jgi:site-specific recombinase XerC
LFPRRARNIILVKEFLGHRSIETTMLYIQLEEQVFQTDSDKFTVKAVNDPKEIQKLLEVGFDYVCEKDGLMFLRRRE